jgi:hypothetical protein
MQYQPYKGAAFVLREVSAEKWERVRIKGLYSRRKKHIVLFTSDLLRQLVLSGARASPCAAFVNILTRRCRCAQADAAVHHLCRCAAGQSRCVRPACATVAQQDSWLIVSVEGVKFFATPQGVVLTEGTVASVYSCASPG